MTSKQTLGSLKGLIQIPSKKTTQSQDKPKVQDKSQGKEQDKLKARENSKQFTVQDKVVQEEHIVPSVRTTKNNSKSSSEKKTKIGTYASAEFQNWLATPIQKPKIKRSKKTNDDAYQVFQDFSENVENPDWKAFFQKLYTGKFPHGYSYRNQTIFFRKRTKIEKLEIVDSSRTTLSKVMNFFTMYGGYSSDKDDLNIYDFIISNTSHYESWRDIRSKKTKQFFIQKYIDRLEDIHDLSELEKRLLVDTVHTGLLLKTIDNGDIEFEDNRIVNIKTLNWNEETREFELPIITKTKAQRKSNNEKIQKNTFLSHWEKFVTHIQKNKIQEDSSYITVPSGRSEDVDLSYTDVSATE
jgi:hypothetical protein